MNVQWRWRARARRRAAPVADSQDIANLLENVHQLRLTLTADLAAAASAIEADEPAVARDIVAADRDEVRRLIDRPPSQRRAPRPEPRREPARPRRALLALPAIPLVGALAMTGAVALNGGDHPSRVQTVVHHTASPTATGSPGEIRQTATTTLRQLERVVSLHPGGGAVVAVATDLHRQLTAILATSPNNTKRLNEVQHLLTVEQRLLETHHGHATAIALAASRQIAHLLNVRNLSTAVPSSPPTSQPHVTATPTKSATPKSATPEPTVTKSQTPQPHASPTAPANPFPSPTPTSRTTHRSHHHHHHPNNSLLGNGLVNRAP